jgi:hypothetical protein
MSALINVVRELTGLFVDDGWLALQILGVLMFAAIFTALMPDVLATTLVLLFGCLGVLMADAARAARR